MRNKVISVLVALALIVVVAAVSFGGKLLDKYSYSKELADLDEYFGVTEGELAIILQDEMISEKAVVRDECVYFSLDTVHDIFNEGFYVDRNEQKLLYTTAVDTISTAFEGKEYSDNNGSHATAYATCYMQGDMLYVAADYVLDSTGKIKQVRFDKVTRC